MSKTVIVFQFFIILLIGITADPLIARQNSFVRIQVYSEDDGNPLQGAVLMIYHAESEPDLDYLFVAVSDQDGIAEFRDLPPDSYLLVIRYIGFSTFRELISTESVNRLNKRVYLQSSVDELDNIEIREQRYITTGEVGLRRITPAQINRIPSPGAGGDLSAYLQTIPGVITIGDQGGNLFIRGGTPDQNLIMVDNIPIIKPFHISNLFSAFSGEIIQTADLYAGGFGARYSGATSAILDIRLRPGNMRQKSGMIAASPYMGALKLEGPLEKDRQSFLLMGRYSLMEYTTSILTQSKQEVRFVDAVGKYTIQGESITCNITGVYTYDQGIINPLREFNLSWSNKVAGARCLGFDHFFTYPLEATFGYTGYTNWEGSLFQDSRRSSISQLFLKVDNKGNMFNHPVNYGFGLTLGLYKARLEERFTAVRSFRDRNPVLNFYMSSEFNPVTQLTLQPGFASQMSIDANPTFEPRFRMSYKPGNSGKREFSLAAGRYYQFLSAISDERDAGTVFMAWIPRLSNDLVPSSTHLMAGYRDELLQMVHIQFEIYTKWHQNIPVSKWTPIAELEIETAYADGFTYGADLNLEIDQAPWYATLSYGLAYIKYESISGDLGAWIEDVIFGYNPPHDQRHKIHISSGFKVGEYNINTSWEYGSGQPYTRVFGFDLFLNIPRRFPTDYPGIARTLYSEPYGERLPSYHRLDFTVERTFLLKNSIELTMKAGALNLYNRNNIFYFDLNTLQRVDQTSFMPFISSELHF